MDPDFVSILSKVLAFLIIGWITIRVTKGWRKNDRTGADREETSE